MSDLQSIWDEILHEATHHLNEATRLVAEMRARPGYRINCIEDEALGRVVAAQRLVGLAAQKLQKLDQSPVGEIV